MYSRTVAFVVNCFMMNNITVVPELFNILYELIRSKYIYIFFVNEVIHEINNFQRHFLRKPYRDFILRKLVGVHLKY